MASLVSISVRRMISTPAVWPPLEGSAVSTWPRAIDPSGAMVFPFTTKSRFSLASKVSTGDLLSELSMVVMRTSILVPLGMSLPASAEMAVNSRKMRLPVIRMTGTPRYRESTPDAPGSRAYFLGQFPGRPRLWEVAELAKDLGLMSANAIACTPSAQSVVRSRACGFESERKRAGEPGLEIQQAHPVRGDGDANHAGYHPAQLCNPGLSLFASEVAFGGDGVFGDNSIHGFKARPAAHEKNLVGERVVIDSERSLWIPGQRFELGSPGGRGQHEIAAVPVKPDGNHPWRTVSPDVGEAGGVSGF